MWAFSLLFPTFGHREVPSRNFSGIVRSSLCPVLRGIVTISTANCIALHAKFARERSPHAPVHPFRLLRWESVILQHISFPLHIQYISRGRCTDCNNVNTSIELNLADFLKITTKLPNLKPRLIYPTIRYTVCFISVLYTTKSIAIACNHLQDSHSEGDVQKAQIW